MILFGVGNIDSFPVGEIVDEVKEVNKGMQRAFHQREDHHRQKMVRALTKEQQECHQAFKTSPYEQYKNINPDRAEGTCGWILENSQYLDCRTSTREIFCGYRPIGMRKIGSRKIPC